jgi:hypothetical protein
VLTRWGFLAVAFVALRRSFGTVLALLALLVLASFVQDPAVPLAFAGALWLVLRPEAGRWRLPVAAGLGLLAGVELLAKINTGVTILCLLLGAIVLAGGRDRLQLLAVAAGGALVTGAIGWIVTGQSLGAVFDYARNSARIVSGYSAAMIIEDPTITLAVHGSAAGRGRRGGRPVARHAGAVEAAARRRAGAVARPRLSELQAGFRPPRHPRDPLLLHDADGARRRAWARGLRGFAAVAMAVPLLALIATSNLRLDDIVAPLDRVEVAWDQLEPVFSGAERREIVEAGDLNVAAATGLDAGTLELLRGRTTHVLPVEAAVVAAHDLRWKPLPVFQDYQAYTAGLDQLNADALLAPDAPERVLLGRDQTIDGRWPGWDPPAQGRALLCRYVPLRAQGRRWLVLGRAENRCGAPKLVGSVRAAWNERVGIPRATGPDQMLFVRVSGVAVGGLERLRSLAYKAHERRVTFDGERKHRLVPGTAANGFAAARARSRWSCPGCSPTPPGPRSSRSTAPATRRGAARCGTTSTRRRWRPADPAAALRVAPARAADRAGRPGDRARGRLRDARLRRRLLQRRLDRDVVQRLHRRLGRGPRPDLGGLRAPAALRPVRPGAARRHRLSPVRAEPVVARARRDARRGRRDAAAQGRRALRRRAGGRRAHGLVSVRGLHAAVVGGEPHVAVDDALLRGGRRVAARVRRARPARAAPARRRRAAVPREPRAVRDHRRPRARGRPALPPACALAARRAALGGRRRRLRPRGSA